MPTIITRSVGPDADHPDLAAFAAAAPDDLVAADEIWVAELLGQDPGGAAFNAVCDAQRYFALRPVSGQSFADGYDPQNDPLRFDAAYGAGVWAASGDALTIEGDHTRLEIEDLQIGAANGAAIRCVGAANAHHLRRLILDGASTEPLAATAGVVEGVLAVQRGEGPALRLETGAFADACTLTRPNASEGAAPVAIECLGGAVTIQNIAVLGFLSADVPQAATRAAIYHDLEALHDVLSVDGRSMNTNGAGWGAPNLSANASASVLGPDLAQNAIRYEKAAGSGGSIFSSNTPVQELTTYRLSFWVRAESLDADAFSVTIQNRSVLSNLVFKEAYSVSSGAWRRVVRDFQTPSGCFELRLYPFVARTNDHGGGFYLDMVRLDPLSAVDVFEQTHDASLLDARPRASAVDVGGALASGVSSAALDILGRSRGGAPTIGAFEAAPAELLLAAPQSLLASALIEAAGAANIGGSPAMPVTSRLAQELASPNAQGALRVEGLSAAAALQAPSAQAAARTDAHDLGHEAVLAPVVARGAGLNAPQTPTRRTIAASRRP